MALFRSKLAGEAGCLGRLWCPGILLGELVRAALGWMASSGIRTEQRGLAMNSFTTSCPGSGTKFQVLVSAGCLEIGVCRAADVRG